jgi:hypothetical protein
MKRTTGGRSVGDVLKAEMERMLPANAITMKFAYRCRPSLKVMGRIAARFHLNTQKGSLPMSMEA